MYRTKVLNYLNEYYLKPILEFDGLTIDGDDSLCRLKRIDADEQGKSSYLINQTKDKNFSFVKDYESFYAWKQNKDHLEFFNPFIKYKHALFLLLMSSPVLYTRFCKTIDNDEELSDLIVSEQLDITQEELLKYVNFQQLTTELNDNDEKIYAFSIELRSDNGDNWKCISKSPIKIVSIIMLMLYIIEYIDGLEPEIYTKCNNNWDDVEADLIHTLELYLKERKLNKKDMVKDQSLIEENRENIEYDLGSTNSSIDEMDEIDFINSSSQDENTDEEKVANTVNKSNEIDNMIKTVLINQDSIIEDDWSHLTFI